MARVNGIDHIAIVVKDLEKSLEFYTAVLGLDVTHRETLKEEGIHVAFISIGGAAVELIEPFDDNCYTAKCLKRYGQGLVHICFSTDDINTLKEAMEDVELFILGEGIRNGARGRKVMFLHPKDNSGVLTEFSQSTP
jgi:methylmalonyl-CoA/ethylmalonyl-CoA epimerase